MAQNTKITAKDVLNWHGSDHGIEELASYLANILNGDCPVDTAKQDIIKYKQQSSED